MKISRKELAVAAFTLLATVSSYASLAYAQTADENQLRSTIAAEIKADPRSKNMTQAQVYALVNALTQQAQQQNITNTQLTYRPQVPTGATAYFGACGNISCSLSSAFGLDGSLPIIPIALIVLAILFIAIYSVMRELGHPHAQG